MDSAEVAEVKVGSEALDTEVGCSVVDGSGVEEALLVATADDSLIVGCTITGGRPAVEPETLVVVSVVSVGSNIIVLEITIVVTRPSPRVAVESETDDSAAPDSTSWVEATVDVGKGDPLVGGTVETGSVEGGLEEGF